MVCTSDLRACHSGQATSSQPTSQTVAPMGRVVFTVHSGTVASTSAANALLDYELSRDSQSTACVTDVTNVRTLDGWLFLAAILDLHSRWVFGMGDELQ